MKQALVNLRTGEVSVADVPVPQLRAGTVLVRNAYSVISAGTEGATVQLGRMNLLDKARARPEQLRKVVNVVRTQGLLTAYLAATRTLETPIPTGYSCAGEVVGVGAGVEGLRAGDRVACMGAPFAHHAEFVCVPPNLCVPVPDGVDLRDAAITSIGAIALNALRVGEMAVGERIVIIGLGLIGLLATQLARAAGCQVFGVDLDPRRVAHFREQGYGLAGEPGDALAPAVNGWSRGEGADLVLISASAPTNAPVALAGELARRRGRVVVVGRTEMSAPRETYLFKEVQLRTAFSCGPGADDPSYELAPDDYPVDLVRWSERRNAVSFLDLLAGGNMQPRALVTHEFALADAAEAFAAITSGDQAAIAVVLQYDAPPEPVVEAPKPAARASSGRLRVSVIGAGSHAINEVIPRLAAEGRVALRGIVSASGVKAAALGRKYGFAYAAGGPDEILADADTDAVVVLTRHDTHAELAAAALQAGKHVLVEKPLSLDAPGLQAVEAAARASGRVLKVGFNRRHAPLALRLKERFAARVQPMSLFYRANVGYRPPGHWLHHPEQGGGVLLGEACHFVDFCCWLVGAPVTATRAASLRGQPPALIGEDNLHLQIEFADGSLAAVHYLSNGSVAAGREYVEVFAEQGYGRLWDFRRLELGRGLKRQTYAHWRPDFGHRRQLDAFVAEALGVAAAPAFSDLDSSRVVLALDRQLRGGTGERDAA